MSKDNTQKKKGIPAGILIFIGLIFLPVILLLLFVTLKLIIEGKDVIIVEDIIDDIPAQQIKKISRSLINRRILWK